MIHRIHIIGGPGSGKSYLGARLSEKLGIKYTDLDNIRWDNTGSEWDKKKDADVRDAELRAVLKKKSWILEGAYGDEWIVPSLKKADIIIVLKPSLLIRQWRVWKRFLLQFCGVTTTKRDNLRSVFKLLKWSHTYTKKYFPKAQQLLKPYAEKVITVTKAHWTVDEIVEIISTHRR